MNHSLQAWTERHFAAALKSTFHHIVVLIGSASDSLRSALPYSRMRAYSTLAALSRSASDKEGVTVGTPSSLPRILLTHVRNRLAAHDTSPLVYGLSFFISLFALAIAGALQKTLPQSIDLVFFAGVVLCSGIGGIRAGLFATAFALVSSLLFLRGVQVSSGHPILSSILFTGTALLASIVCDGLAIARRQAEIALESSEATGRRAVLLAEASALLDSSADYRTTLENVARLITPRFADWCIIDLAAGDSGGQVMVLAHRDRKKEDALRRMRAAYPLDVQGNGVIARVLRSGKAELIAEFTGEILIGAAHSTEHLKTLLELRPKSAIYVPLISSGRTIGVLTCVMSTSDRAYSPPDLSIAKDLAQRVALSVDNAQLYQAAQQEILVRRQAEERILVLNAQLQRAMTETHHRVKNNLQLISAMIDIQLMDEAESYPAEDVRRLGNSVRTLAVIHDLLTQEAKKNGNSQMLSSKKVLEKLLTLMSTTAGNCRLRFQIDDVKLFASESASLALITNELVSNAIKHGNSAVHTSFVVRNGRATLEVCDDGPGFPAHFDSAVASNIGLELVENLSRLDLQGQVRYENGHHGGGRVIMTMPVQTHDRTETFAAR